MNPPTLLIAVLLILSGACTAPVADLAADREQIARNIADWKELGKTGDPDKTLAYFADDVMIFPAGQPVLKGLDAVRRLVETRTGPRRTTTWDVLSSITVAGVGSNRGLATNIICSFGTRQLELRVLRLVSCGLAVWTISATG